MQYRRVDEDTIQCIVSGADMSERGLTLGDLLTRSDRAEGFLRELIEEAHEQIGYELKGTSLALQISPTQDEGMIITITNDDSFGFRGFLEHMKNVMEAIVGGTIDELFEEISSMDDPDLLPQKEQDKPSEQPEDIRVFEFASMGDVLDFAADGFVYNQVRSILGYADEKYYLIVVKNRCSWKNFNKLSAKAFDYANVIPDVRGKMVYLSEHGEELIGKGALGHLKKIANP